MKIFLSFILLISLSSCLTIGYLVPQPKGVKRELVFPENLQGTYSVNESITESEIYSPKDTLIVHKNFIESHDYITKKVALNMVDSTIEIKIKDKKIYDSRFDSMKGLDFQTVDDTIRYSYIKKDFIYLSDSVIFKTYKNLYFLNTKTKEDKFWISYFIEPRDSQVFDVYFLSLFSNDEEDENKDDSTSTLKDSNEVTATDSLHKFTTRDSNSVVKYNSKVKTKTIDDKDALETICKITKCKKVNKNTYLINPSKRKLMKLIKTLKQKEMLVLMETIKKVKN